MKKYFEKYFCDEAIRKMVNNECTLVRVHRTERVSGVRVLKCSMFAQYDVRSTLTWVNSECIFCIEDFHSILRCDFSTKLKVSQGYTVLYKDVLSVGSGKVRVALVKVWTQNKSLSSNSSYKPRRNSSTCSSLRNQCHHRHQVCRQILLFVTKIKFATYFLLNKTFSRS